MNLVEHEHVIRQPPQPERLEFRRQHAQQCLVDGADTDMRQQRLAAIVGEPGGADGCRVVLVVAGGSRGWRLCYAEDGAMEFVVQVPLAVCEH